MPGRQRENVRFPDRDSRTHRSSIRWRGLAIAAVSVIFGLASASEAGASVVFHTGESIGTFKVLGGHFKQQNNYLANYKTDSGDGCYIYKFSDQGGSTYDLTFDKGEVSPLKYRTGYVDFVHDLLGSGKVSRKWSGRVASQPGRNYDDSCDPPKPPTFPVTGCGTKTVKGADSFPFGLAPAEGGGYSRSGRDATLFGLVFSNDPLAGCPSDSVYGDNALDSGSDKGMQELDNAKVGDEVKLKANSSINSSDPLYFNVPFKWTTGSQTASVDWSLTLKRVPKHR